MNDTHGWSPDVQATFCATLVDEWVRCGLTDAVVCPGSRSTPLAIALAVDDRVHLHVHHDERSGSFLALGLAQVTGRPSLVLTTSGTAVVQLHAAVTEADLAGVPLIVCSADLRPGQPLLRAPRLAPVLDRELASARGVVVAGRGTPDPDAMTALAEDLGWPLLADPSSGCRGRGAIGAFDSILRTAFGERVSPQVVIRSGGPPASKVLGQWIERCSPRELVVAPERWWPDPSRSAAVFVDAVPAVPDGHEPVEGWRQMWSEVEQLAQSAVDVALEDMPMSEPGVARQLTRLLPPGAVLVSSSSMPVRDVEWFGVPRSDVRFLANRGANGIDGVVSTAVGSAIAGAKTVLLIGDVAFLHDSNGLLGLTGRDVDLTIVVLDNDGGGIFSFLPQHDELDADRFERLFGTPHGLDLVAVARSFGVEARFVDTAEDLAWTSGTRVLVVRTDRDENVAVHARLHDAVAHAIHA